MNERRIKKAHRLLDEKIVGCYNCQPYDEGHPVWLGPTNYIYEILEDYEYSEDQLSEILNDYRCPNCGTNLTEKYDEVQVKSKIDYQIESVFNKISDKRRINSLNNFNNYLCQYPYLGSNHSLGRRIIKSIKNGTKHTINDEIWFRARLLNKESRLFKSEEMLAPNPNDVYIREGRYNHTGQSFLYLSSYEETAFSEIASNDDNVCVIQKLKISSIDNILDLRQDYSKIDIDADILVLAIIYNGYVSQKPDKNISWKPEYFVTRYLADAARQLDYNGLIYSSVANYGDNLVLFDSQNRSVTTFEEPYLFTKPKERNSFYTDIEI